MRRTDTALLTIGFAVSLFALGCSRTASPLSRMSPIQPPAVFEGPYANIVIDNEAKPQPIMELTKNDVTVTVQFWRKYELDRKLNRGSVTSAFYSEPTWKQGDQVDVFWVSVQNKRKSVIRVKLADFQIEDNLRLRDDMDGNIYLALDEAANRERLLYREGQNIAITNGLQAIKPSLFQTHIPKNEIAPGEKAEGYVPFYKVKPNAESMVLTIAVEAPTEGQATAARFQKISFDFPYRFDRAIHEAQPGTLRY